MRAVFMCVWVAAFFTLVATTSEVNTIVPESFSLQTNEVTPIVEKTKEAPEKEAAGFTEEAMGKDECTVKDADGKHVSRPGNKCAPAGKCGLLKGSHIFPMFARKGASVNQLGAGFCRWDCELGKFPGDFKIYDGHSKCCFPGPYVLARNYGVSVTGKFAGLSARSHMRLYELNIAVPEMTKKIRVVRSSSRPSGDIHDVLEIFIDGKRKKSDFRDSLVSVTFKNGKPIRGRKQGGNTGHATIELAAGKGEFILHLSTNDFFVKGSRHWWVDGSQQQGGDMRLLLTSTVPTTTSSLCGMLFANPSQEQLRKLRQA